MSADWHVARCDKVWVLTQLSILAARQRHLEDKIRLAVYRQRFSSSASEVERARQDELDCLKSLDSILTSIRAIEGKLSLMPHDA
jgi:hypothetical protein